MRTAATKWAAVRVLVAAVGSETAVVGGVWERSGGCVPPTHNAGRAALSGAPRPWSGLMYVFDVGKGVPRQGAAAPDCGQAWLSQKGPLP